MGSHFSPINSGKFAGCAREYMCLNMNKSQCHAISKGGKGHKGRKCQYINASEKCDNNLCLLSVIVKKMCEQNKNHSLIHTHTSTW